MPIGVGDEWFPCCSLEDVAMIIETYRSSPSEVSSAALSLPVMAQQPAWGGLRELEKAGSGDDEVFSLVVRQPQWPRIFPSL